METNKYREAPSREELRSWLKEGWKGLTPEQTLEVDIMVRTTDEMLKKRRDI